MKALHLGKKFPGRVQCQILPVVLHTPISPPWETRKFRAFLVFSCFSLRENSSIAVGTIRSTKPHVANNHAPRAN